MTVVIVTRFLLFTYWHKKNWAANVGCALYPVMFPCLYVSKPAKGNFPFRYSPPFLVNNAIHFFVRFINVVRLCFSKKFECFQAYMSRTSDVGRAGFLGVDGRVGRLSPYLGHFLADVKNSKTTLERISRRFKWARPQHKRTDKKIFNPANFGDVLCNAERPKLAATIYTFLNCKTKGTGEWWHWRSNIMGSINFRSVYSLIMERGTADRRGPGAMTNGTDHNNLIVEWQIRRANY